MGEQPRPAFILGGNWDAKQKVMTQMLSCLRSEVVPKNTSKIKGCWVKTGNTPSTFILPRRRTWQLQTSSHPSQPPSSVPSLTLCLSVYFRWKIQCRQQNKHFLYFSTFIKIACHITVFSGKEIRNKKVAFKLVSRGFSPMHFIRTEDEKSACNTEDTGDIGSIPGLGRSPGGGSHKTHSSILAWKIPWTEAPGGLQSKGSHRVGHDWSDLAEH